MRPIRKIHIIGSVGSGKTYLAAFLSNELAIPFYQLDNVVWDRTPQGGGNIRNPIEVRDRQLADILAQEEWIIEGAHHKWILPSFEAAELVIYLSPSKRSRDLRGISRFIKQRLGLEKGNFKPPLLYLLKHFKWNRDYDRINKPEIMDMLAPHKDKVIVVKSNNEIIRHIAKWKSEIFHTSWQPTK